MCRSVVYILKPSQAPQNRHMELVFKEEYGDICTFEWFEGGTECLLVAFEGGYVCAVSTDAAECGREIQVRPYR